MDQSCFLFFLLMSVCQSFSLNVWLLSFFSFFLSFFFSRQICFPLHQASGCTVWICRAFLFGFSGVLNPLEICDPWRNVTGFYWHSVFVVLLVLVVFLATLVLSRPLTCPLSIAVLSVSSIIEQGNTRERGRALIRHFE